MKFLSKRFIFVCFSLVILTAFIITGCKNNVDCQSPPPKFYFQITNQGSVYPSPVDTSVLKISYMDKDQKTYLPEVIAKADSYYNSLTIIEHSWAMQDPEFSLELNGLVVSKLKLETFINNAKCQGWATISKVYQNGQIIPMSSNGSYQLGGK